MAQLNELKKHLSDYAERAAAGEIIHITRFNRPYIVLAPDRDASLHWGELAGKSAIKPVLKKGSRGRWLKFLAEDRNEK